jgi:hypothetical protein
LAARYLRRPGRWLPELNRAVFPVYVLHSPVTLVGLALVAQISWPWPLDRYCPRKPAQFGETPVDDMRLWTRWA